MNLVVVRARGSAVSTFGNGATRSAYGDLYRVEESEMNDPMPELLVLRFVGGVLIDQPMPGAAIPMWAGTLERDDAVAGGWRRTLWGSGPGGDGAGKWPPCTSAMSLSSARIRTGRIDGSGTRLTTPPRTARLLCAVRSRLPRQRSKQDVTFGTTSSHAHSGSIEKPDWRTRSSACRSATCSLDDRARPVRAGHTAPFRARSGSRGDQ